MLRKFYYIATTLLLLVFMPVDLSAQSRKADIDAQRKQVNRLKKEVDNSKKRVDLLTSEKGSASRRVKELNRQINLRASVIAETEYEIELVESDIATLELSIDSLNRAYEHSKELYAKMVRQAARISKRNGYETYIYAATSLEDLSRRISNVERFAERYKDIAKVARHQRDELSLVRANLDVRRAELDSVMVALDEERRELNASRSIAMRDYEKLTNQEREALSAHEQKQQEYNNASKQLERILAENTVGSNFSSNTRGLKLPIEGGRIRPLQANMIEISGPRGAAVRCVEAGTVGEITAVSGGQYIIKVAHGKDFYTIYTQVSQVCVKVGQKLTENQKIGTAGVFVDYDNSERSFIQFMVYNHRKGELEEVMKFFSKK